LLGVLLFDNVASEARDIAANERSTLLESKNDVDTNWFRSISFLVETQYVHGNRVCRNCAVFPPEVDAIKSG
jgi:hypothetical protein